MGLTLRYIDSNYKENEKYISFLDFHEYVCTQGKYDVIVNSIDNKYSIELDKKLEPKLSGEILGK